MGVKIPSGVTMKKRIRPTKKHLIKNNSSKMPTPCNASLKDDGEPDIKYEGPNLIEAFKRGLLL